MIWKLYNFIQCEAFFLDAGHALVLFDRFDLKDDLLKARIYFLNGDLKKALAISAKLHDYYLTADILIANNKYTEAISALANVHVDGRWYYYMGRCYGHLCNNKKAIVCLQKSVEYYDNNNDKVRAMVARANLAVFYQSAFFPRKAEMAFRQVYNFIIRGELDRYPKFKACALLNYGYFHQIRGNFSIAIKIIWKAHKTLLFAPESDYYSRATVLLANIFKELGYYRRAISLLLSVKPSKAYMALDKYRCLISCYSMMGMYGELEEAFVQAVAVLDKKDLSGEVHLNIDYAEAIYDIDADRAAKLFYKALSQAVDQNDKELEFYCNSRIAWWTKDNKLASSTIDFHLKNKFLIDAYWDKLTIAYSCVQKGQFIEALNELQKFVKHDLPFHEGYRFFLMGICCVQLSQHALASKYLWKSYELIK